MLQTLRQALESSPEDHQLFNAHDDNLIVDRDSIEAAIVWIPPDDFFDDLPNLRHVYALAAGVDQLLRHKGLAQHVQLVRLQDAGMAVQMSEYVLYGVLRAQRHFHRFDVAQKQIEWIQDLPIVRACDTRVGILGAGVLASAAAGRLRLNGYTVGCWSRSHKQLPDGIGHVHGKDALPDFLAACDVLVCLLPLTDATSNILNTRLFYQLPKGAYVINCARGQHLVEVDLLNAIDEQQLSGAMLDVFHHEPLPPNHPFWSHPQILVTPHDAAKTSEHEAVEQIMRSIMQVQRGEKPEGLVDRSTGY